jgi:hypothetical protein
VTFFIYYCIILKVHRLYFQNSKMMETKIVLRRVNWLLAVSIAVLLGTLFFGSTLLISCEPVANEEPVAIDYSKEQLIARGKYLVNTSACNDCHSPKVITPLGLTLDTTRLLSGYPGTRPLPKVNKEALGSWLLFGQDLTSGVGPWGVSFAANITSDETGIGNWSEEQFLTAIRKGKYKGLEGSRDLLPPMPWQVYNGMTDTDLKAIFLYLKTTKPIRNLVPPPIAPNDIQ